MTEHIFQTMQEHMLDSNNIARWCRYIDLEEVKPRSSTAVQSKRTKQSSPQAPVKRDECFIPKTRDKLFWCFFVAQKGYGEFMKAQGKMFVHENETKYAAVSALRESKDKLKAAKIKVQDTECDLVGPKPITLNVLHALAVAYSLSFLVLNEDIYYDFSYGEQTHVIDITNGQTKLLLGEQSTKVATIKETKYYILPSKPIKAMSSYSATEVQGIASKLSIPLFDESGKSYNKTSLYGLIQSKLGKLI